MASILLIAGILIAVKVAEEHEKKKAGLQEQIADSPIIEYDSANFHTTESEPSSKPLSKRDILTRRYWHERRRSRNRSVTGSESLSENEAERDMDEAPPAYMGPPAYRELAPGEHDDVGNGVSGPGGRLSSQGSEWGLSAAGEKI
ncbi:hypothetical protein BJY04DRAFT_216707 [Aspergillus karnatakaensis]|uniref:uncharacterized protein n=1 Tax=Aspergillus karnatakaensis TaxID=1810916 RepID=UPI003CCCB2AC